MKFSKANIKTYLITMYSSSFIKKYLLSYIVIICLFFSFFVVITSTNYTSQINDMNSKSLLQASITNDTLFSNLYTFCYKNFTENPDLVSIMYAKEFTPELSMSTSNVLNSFMNYNNMIESIYIVNAIQDVVFSTYGPFTSIEDFFDQDIIARLNDPNTPMFPSLYIPREVSFSINNYKNYHQRLLSMIFRVSENGALIININQDKFASMINAEMGDPSAQTIILNNAGQVISDTHNNYFSQSFIDNPLYQLVHQRPDDIGIFNTSVDNQKSTINFRKQNKLGFTYMTLTKHAFLDIGNAHFSYAMPYIILFIIITLVLAFILSWILYLPIRKLKNTVAQSRFTKDTVLQPAQNEFAYISEAFTSIHSKYNTLEKNASIYLQAKKDKVLRNLLSSRDALSTFTLNDFESVNIHFNFKKILVLVISIDNYEAVLTQEKSDISLIKYAITNVATELLNSHYTCESLDMSKDKIVFILNFSTYDKEMLDNFLTQLQQSILSYFNISFSIGIGTLQEEIEDISISYTYASTALLYRLIQDNGCKIYYNDLHIRPSTEQFYPYDLEKNIISAIKASQLDVLKSNIDIFFDSLKSYSYNQIVLNVLQLNHTLERLEYTYEISFIPPPNIMFEDLSFSMSTFTEIKDSLYTRCQNIVVQQQEVKMNTSSKVDLINHVISFINDNKFNCNLSVDLIAQEVNLSVNYLRAIFKEHIGESLSSYITNNKITLICELLTDTDLSIQEICDKLGFTTRNYFFTFFKKHLNMTPSQYRKSNKNSVHHSIDTEIDIDNL